MEKATVATTTLSNHSITGEVKLEWLSENISKSFMLFCSFKDEVFTLKDCVYKMEQLISEINECLTISKSEVVASVSHSIENVCEYFLELKNEMDCINRSKSQIELTNKNISKLFDTISGHLYSDTNEGLQVQEYKPEIDRENTALQTPNNENPNVDESGKTLPESVHTFSKAVLNEQPLLSLNSSVEDDDSDNYDSDPNSSHTEDTGDLNTGGIQSTGNFNCDKCNESFTRSCQLKIHINRTHAKQILDQPMSHRNRLSNGNCKNNSTVTKLKIKKYAVQNLKNKHTCDECGKTFKVEAKLVRHLRVHSGEKPFQCPECGASFGRNSTLKNHIRTHLNSLSKPLKCEECMKYFSNSYNLNRHMNKTHIALTKKKSTDASSKNEVEIVFGVEEIVQKPHKCDECQKCFRQVWVLNEHKKRHARQDGMICPKCDMIFKEENALQAHVVLHDGIKPFMCVMCSKGFANKYALKSHLFVHTGEKSLICDQCGKAFGCNASLKKHMLNHAIVRPYKCEVCDKSYHRRLNLEIHISTHSSEKSFKCSHCDKSFSHAVVLRTHEKLHNPDRPYTCAQCGKGFKKSSNLKDHMNSHSENRPHRCKECGSCFKRTSNLTHHMRKHRGYYPATCHFCGKAFTDHAKCRRHIRIHTGEKPYVCKYCGKGFNQSGSLLGHERIHTGEKPYKCELCEMSFTQRGSLNGHMKTHQNKQSDIARKENISSITISDTPSLFYSASEFSPKCEVDTDNNL